MLRLVADLVEGLQAAQVSYCHWKSNEHLDAALQGLTDLDILVAGRDGAAVARVLADVGFKRFPAAPTASYPGIDDYLGFDRKSGRIIHLHLHYQLTLGEKLIKGYRIPWEDMLLANRQHDPRGIHVADPHLELVLLLVRVALKLQTRDRLFRGRRRPALGRDPLREFQWLAARVDRDRLARVTEPLVGAEATRRLIAFLTNAPTVGSLQAFRRSVRPRLATYRTYGALEARRRRWGRELWRRWRRWTRSRPAGTPSRRTLPHGGRVIAFLGCDGSGKSTVTREIASWLGWKIDVVPLYFGSGDGPASPLRQPLRLLRLVLRRRRRPARASRRVVGGPPRGWSRRILRSWWALTVAREKRDRLTLARRARNLGMIVICDRYPQSQIAGFTDGPLLSYWDDDPSPVLRYAARWEAKHYRAASTMPPDLVVKLHVSQEMALQRKPEMVAERLPRRIEAIRELAFPASVVLDIDADQPLEDVLRQVKETVWAAL
jgi:thymidylate kinase